MVEILVHYTEKQDFSGLNGEVNTHTGDTGDLLIISLDCCIENKTARDMWASILDGRAKKQAEKMQIYSKRFWYIKMMDSNYLTKPQLKAIETFCIKLYFVYKILPIKVWDQESHIYSINKLIEYLQKTEEELIIEHFIKTFGRFETLYDRKVMAISAADGYGFVNAKKIVDKFETIEKIVNCNKEDFLTLDGIGDVKANNLYEFLHR